MFSQCATPPSPSAGARSTPCTEPLEQRAAHDVFDIPTPPRLTLHAMFVFYTPSRLRTVAGWARCDRIKRYGYRSETQPRMFSRTGTNAGPKRSPPPPPPNAAPGLAMNAADFFQHSAASWQRSPNRDMWAACHGANSALPSYTYAYFGPSPTPTPVAFAPARVPAWHQAAETAAESVSVDRSPGNGSRTRAIAHCAAPSSGVPESIQRSARAAEAAYRAYYTATGGGGMHSGRAPSPFGPVSPPVERRIKRPAPPAPSAPKAHGPTDAGLRTALLHTVEQRCASQQEASVTLAESKKRPRERPSDDDALKDERVVVWNQVTGKTLTGQVAL